MCDCQRLGLWVWAVAHQDSVPAGRYRGSGHGRSDFARDLLIKSDHLRRALTNIIGIGLRLGLPNGALRDRTGSRTIGNRHVLAHIETRPKGVLDDISNSRACRGQELASVPRTSQRPRFGRLLPRLAVGRQ